MFFSCIKKYILVFSPLISLQGDTLNAFIRDIYKLRLLFFPSPDLYEHIDYQWLPSFSGAIKYNKKEFTYGGINLVRAYDEENSNYQTEKEILEHLLHFRETKIGNSSGNVYARAAYTVLAASLRGIFGLNHIHELP